MWKELTRYLGKSTRQVTLSTSVLAGALAPAGCAGTLRDSELCRTPEDSDRSSVVVMSEHAETTAKAPAHATHATREPIVRPLVVEDAPRSARRAPAGDEEPGDAEAVVEEPRPARANHRDPVSSSVAAEMAARSAIQPTGYNLGY